MIQTLPQFCLGFIELFFWGAAFILVLATGAGIAYVNVELAARKKAIDAGKIDSQSGGGFPDAAKALVEALSKAPVWLGLFVQGLLLIWVASNEIPKVCRVPVVERPASQTPANGSPASPPTKPAGGSTAPKGDRESGG